MGFELSPGPQFYAARAGSGTSWLSMGIGQQLYPHVGGLKRRGMQLRIKTLVGIKEDVDQYGLDFLS